MSREEWRKLDGFSLALKQGVEFSVVKTIDIS